MTTQGAPPGETRPCEMCGAANRITAAWCWSCGRALRSAPAQPAPPAAQPATVAHRRGTPPRRTRSVLVGTLVLATVVVALAVAGGWFGLTSSRPDATRSGALAVATRFSANWATLDHRRLDDDLERIRADATDSFASTLVPTSDRSEEFTEQQARSTGTVVRSAISEIDGRRAKALVVVKQITTNRARSGTRSRTVLLELTLVLDDEDWRVEGVEELISDSAE